MLISLLRFDISKEMFFQIRLIQICDVIKFYFKNKILFYQRRFHIRGLNSRHLIKGECVSINHSSTNPCDQFNLYSLDFNYLFGFDLT